MQPAAGAKPVADPVHRAGSLGQDAMHCVDCTAVFGLHDLQQLQRGQRAQLVCPRVGFLAHPSRITSAAASPETRDAPWVAT